MANKLLASLKDSEGNPVFPNPRHIMFVGAARQAGQLAIGLTVLTFITGAAMVIKGGPIDVRDAIEEQCGVSIPTPLFDNRD